MADQDSKLRLNPEQIDVDTLEVEELDQVAGGAAAAPTDTCPIENWQCTNTCPPPPATSVAAE